MAINKITGRLIALSQVKEVRGSDPSKAPIRKREIYIDCTRYDPYTGERSQYENKPLLELGGDKLLQKVDELHLVAGDIVALSFDIQGVPYVEKGTGKNRVFTSIRVYDVEKVRGQQRDGQQPSAAVSQHPVASPQFIPNANDDAPF